MGISLRSGTRSKVALKLSASSDMYSGTLPIDSSDSATCTFLRMRSWTEMTSPSRAWAEGMSRRRPLTRMWPWPTSWRAAQMVGAKPAR